MNYAINPNGKLPIFQLNQHIGFDEEDGQGICGKTFSREFFEIDSLMPDMITTYVNSMGGSVEEGFDIFNAIINAKSKTKTVISGFAYSTAGWCALAADVVEAYDYSTWMCHLPYDPTDPNKRSPFLEIVLNSVATIISEKSGRNGKLKKSVEEVKQMMIAKTYYTAEDMYNAGLIDRYITSNGKAKKLVVDNNGNLKVIYKEHQKVVNKFIQDTFNTNKMEKVINRLKLAANSNEDAILSAIAGLENQVTAANKEKDDLGEKLKASNESQEELQKRMNDVQNDLSKVNADMKSKDESINKLSFEKDKLEKELEDLKAEKDAADNKAKEDAEAAKKDKAKTLVANFVKIGKVEDKAETIAVWEESAVENYERTEAILNALPTNFNVPMPVGTPIVNMQERETTPGTPEFYRAENRKKREERDQRFKAQLNG